MNRQLFVHCKEKLFLFHYLVHTTLVKFCLIEIYSHVRKLELFSLPDM